MVFTMCNQSTAKPMVDINLNLSSNKFFNGLLINDIYFKDIRIYRARKDIGGA
jgi:hypothetical protein